LIKIPWEETADYIRSGHKDPDRYETCRTITISADEGIKATYCKLKNVDRWEIQSYLFSKAKGWTMSKAKEWFSQHQASVLSLKFFASLQSWEEKDGRNLATFYLIDDGVNMNNWQVTDEALEKALPSLIGKPLSARPGYRVDHVSSPIDVGTFVKVEKPDGYAIGVAEIRDETAWEKIKNKEWGPISVELKARRVICSKCGRDILDEPDEHVLSGEAHEVITDFTFERFAFVSEPAYPMAGILFAGQKQTGPADAGSGLTKKKEGEMQREAEKFAGVIPFREAPKAPEDMSWDFNAADYTVDQLRRACAWYDSGNPDVKGSYKLPHHLPDGRVVWRGVVAAMQVLLGARGGVNIPDSDRKEVYAHLVKHYRQFGKEPPEFHASQSPRGDELKGALNPEVKNGGGEERVTDEKIAELQTKLDAVTAENKQLKAELDRIKEERHLEKVKEVVDLRMQAGLIKDAKAETERLKALNDQSLEIMKADAKAFIAEKERIAKVAGPKAKYSAGGTDDLTKKIEDMRERFFGHRKSLLEGGAN